MAIPMRHLSEPADTVGGRIAQARRWAELNQDQLGDEADASRKTISQWENDKTSPTVAELFLIANATGRPATFFVEGLDDQPDGPDRIPKTENR